MLYPEKLVNKICSKNGIVSVVSEYLPLKKIGRMYYGKCPFHDEEAPSFVVDQKSQQFRCFGCGAGGNVIAFVMLAEKCSFIEALRKLSERIHVALTEIERPAIEKNEIISMNILAGRHYYRNLTERENDALGYLEKRGLSREIIKKFGLGLSDPYGECVCKLLRERGFTDEAIEESGLVFFDRETQRPHDRFWNRVMFPMLDEDGLLIGFGGRITGNGKVKYLNSPETPVFNKGRHLYGLNFARHTRREYMILCEGYMDVIALHQAGFDNAVASLGTALTSEQARLLAGYTKKVYLSYDSDAAGVHATVKAIQLLEDAGIEVKVINLGTYKDPDEFIKACGSAAYEGRIKAAQSSDRFRIKSNPEDVGTAVDILLKYL